MTTERRRIRIRGVVQGVGFRPFVYRTAVGMGLAGSVRNLGDAGVEIFVEGAVEAVDAFVRSLKTEAPPLARIETVEAERLEPIGESVFAILPSGGGGDGGGSLPPDTGVCKACVAEILGA
jgi:hydrogenase maturation protein HypF